MITTLTADRRELRTGSVIWLTPIFMLVYSMLRFGAGGRSGSIPVAAAVEAAAYLLTIFLFFGVACLSIRYGILAYGGLTLLMVALSIWLTGGHNVREIVCGWGAIAVGSYSTGHLAESRLSGRAWYLVGLAVVVGFGLVWLIPQWPQLHNAAQAAREILLDDLRSGSSGGLLGSGLLADYSATIESWSSVIIRLLPLILIMNMVLQYTVGFLWFAQVHSATSQGRLSPLKSFPYWRMPFWAVLIVVSAVIARLAGSDTLRLVSDNLLVALAIFYFVIGLSVMEYHLRRFRAHWTLRLLAYVLLLPAGIYGMTALAGVGGINNLYDWRKRSRVE